MRQSQPVRQTGITYIAVLAMVAALSIGLAAVGTVWSRYAQREREAELFFVGEQYRRAIMLYYESSPGGRKSYPPSLSDLLLDTRLGNPRRHLRRMYVDPMTGKADWEVVRAPDGGIAGVHSTSRAPLIRRVTSAGESLAVERYGETIFMYVPVDSRQGRGANAFLPRLSRSASVDLENQWTMRISNPSIAAFRKNA